MLVDSTRDGAARPLRLHRRRRHGAVARACCPCCPRCCRAGATGGRRRPLGHRASGWRSRSRSRSSALAKVVDGVGLGDRRARTIAIVVLLGVRRRARSCRRSATGSRRRSRAWRASARGRAATASGRASASARALGFVYAPCAGPILAAVISVGAAPGDVRDRRSRSPTRSARRSCCSRSRSAAARSPSGSARPAAARRSSACSAR